MIRKIRTQVFWTMVGLALVLAVLGGPWRWGLLIVGPLIVLGVWDLIQPRHNLLRNYPLVGHLRYLIEGTGAELRQYIVESNTEGAPFNRDKRALMYQRAKGVSDKKPFGTELDVYREGYDWLAHSIVAKPVNEDPVREFRVDVGLPGTAHPYSASVYNISAMSFGSLSARAIRSLNDGARRGDFAHNTGEGGVSRHHREPGGDLIWQVGTGYFGCRAEDGGFDPVQFADQSKLEQVRMIELKLSQGAKPGHGGILPAKKVTAEIAEARRVTEGQSCISPSSHRAFSTPIELLELVARLRELSGGKPVGFKLCVGRVDELFAIFKAMMETDLLPDFITVDGAEGGTGAAPIEFSNHIGLPLREGLALVASSLVGIGVKDRVRVAASGKLVTAFEMATALALGADWCYSARGFMFALGCIQAQSCHTDECPVGIATQNSRLQRAIAVTDKAERVHNFHRNTVKALAEVVAAAGLEHPRELRRDLLFERTAHAGIQSKDQVFVTFEPGQLRDGRAGERLQPFWDAARADTF